MERSFVLVLTLVTLVTATPHGYGVKGGASARAEASAVAGGFGDLGPLPLSIPSGSAYSGSFSKSSSSSYASSSASASSSSYSFSGSGANGIAGVGSNKGCSSGTCPGNGPVETSLNGVQQLPGANAVSAAQANAISGAHTPCQGSNCNFSPAEPCTSSECSSGSAVKGPTRCTGNGNCQSPSTEIDLPSENSPDKDKNEKQDGNSDDSNDFAVNINRNTQSKLLHDSNGQYSNNEKSSEPESDCSNGKCSSDVARQSNFGSHQNKYPVPSTHLTTPVENPPCTTPNCKYPPQYDGSVSGNLPTSYNVPIQSATNPPNTFYSSSPKYGSLPNSENSVPGLPCTSSACNSTPYNVGTSNIPNQGTSNQGPCASGQCNIPSSSDKKTNNGVVSGVKIPSYAQGSVLSNVPSGYSGQPGCTTPYCSGLPTYSSLPANQPGSGCSGAACSTTLSGSPTKPSDSDAPVYTGGFGGPPGFLDINSGSSKLPGNPGYDHSHNTPKPSGAFGSTPTQGSFGPTNPTGLNSNNYYGATTNIGGSTGALNYNKPSNGLSTTGPQINPSATGYYGAPIASSPVTQGSLSHPENNGIHKPTTTYTGSSPTNSGSVGDYTGSTSTNSGSNSIQGSFGVTKPNTPANSPNNQIYTGGFGGPSGTGGSGLSFGPPGSFNKPGSANCGSADCNSQLNANANGGSFDKTNPSTSTSNQNKPLYNGGFGGPTGLLKPNNYNMPTNTPPASLESTPCKNGNCGSKGTSLSTQGSSISNAHNFAAAAASANAVAYSGGFGGPPGVLKPYDDGKVNIPANGNIGTGQLPSSDNGHPKTLSVNGKNLEPGSSENGANTAALASASASANAGSYSGNNNYQNNNGASRGCNNGCSPNGAGDGNFGLTDGHSRSLGVGSLASAKSSAGANAYGSAGSFASSSASAHATAGAATKGGYGKK